jgi:hypothetical protein
MQQGIKFQGDSSRLINDSLGVYARLSTAYEQLKVKIGEMLNVAFVPFSTVLIDVVNFIKNNLPLAVGVATGAISGMIIATGALTMAVASLATAVTGATGGLNLLVGAAVALGVGGATAGVMTLTDNVGKFSIALTESNSRIQAIKNGLADMTKEEIRAQIAQKQREIDIQDARNKRLYDQRAEQLATIEAMKQSHAFGLEEKQAMADKTKQSIEINNTVRSENKKTLELYKQQLAQILNTPPPVATAEPKTEKNKTIIKNAQDLSDKLFEIEKRRISAVIDLEAHAIGVKKRADEKELKRMQSYGMEEVDLGEKIAKTKIKGNEETTESGLKQAQSAISSAQSVFAAQANKSKSMFDFPIWYIKIFI